MWDQYVLLHLEGDKLIIKPDECHKSSLLERGYCCIRRTFLLNHSSRSFLHGSAAAMAARNGLSST